MHVHKHKRKYKIRLAFRSFAAAIWGVINASLLISCGVGDIVITENKFLYLAFFVQDCVMISLGGIIALLSFGYMILGCYQNKRFVYEYVRIGRRTTIHYTNLLILPGILNCICSCVCLIHLGKPFNGDNFDALLIMFGLNEKTHMSYYRIILCVGTYFLAIFHLVLYWIDFFRSSTFWCLLRKTDVVGVHSFIDEQRSLIPIVTFHVECFHYETIQKSRQVLDTDEDGNQSTRKEFYYVEEKVVTYRAKKDWNYCQVGDVSGHFTLDSKQRKKNFVKVKLNYVVGFDCEETRQSYLNAGLEFEEENKWRDEYTTLTKKKRLPGFVDTVLANVKEDKSTPWWSNNIVYFFVSFFGMQLIFRYVFDTICGEQNFLIKKVVSSFNTMKRSELDQTIDKKYIIMPHFQERNSLNITPRNSVNIQHSEVTINNSKKITEKNREKERLIDGAILY